MALRKQKARRIRQVERAVRRLVRKGWRLDLIQQTDESGEPYRVTIHLALDRESAMEIL